MGVLSLDLKSYFLDLLKFLNSLNWLIILFSLFNLSVCIYEDQVGKFDWHQSYVGRIKFAQYDTASTAKKIIVATEENVLAALHLKTGQVIWRHVLESASKGNIRMLHVSEKRPNTITVTGTSNPLIVRKWHSSTGVLIWEVPIHVNTEKPETAKFWIDDDHLVQLVPSYGSHLDLTFYNVMQETDGKKMGIQRVQAPWNGDRCVISSPYYICVSGEQIYALNVKYLMNKWTDKENPLVKPLSSYVHSSDITIKPFIGISQVSGFTINENVVLIKNDNFDLLEVKLKRSPSVVVADSGIGPILFHGSFDEEIADYTISGYSITNRREVPELRSRGGSVRPGLDRAGLGPSPALLASGCSGPAGVPVCRLLIGADDHSFTCLQGERVIWTREEALANVEAVEFVDLPISDLDAAIESEFNRKEGSIWGAFVRRLESQLQQLSSLALSWKQGEGTPEESRAPLTRDYFNLHKIIVAVTTAGKIFGIDNLSGEILWRRYEPEFNTTGALIFLLRPARHPPFGALIAIVGKHKGSGVGMVVTLEAGAGTGTDTPLRLETALLQAGVTAQPAPQQQALLLLTTDERVQVIPESAARYVENQFMYVVDPRTANVQGYALQYNGEEVVARRTWSLRLAGGESGVSSETRVGRVWTTAAAAGVAHSAGRVLGDRSVLYKYINPNLVLFLTEYEHQQHKDMLTATCVDVVSGLVVAAQAHRRARLASPSSYTYTYSPYSPSAPPALLADHMIAYAYYNDKHRRTEIATLELYEGTRRWTRTGSLGGGPAPAVERQAYILQGHVAAAAVTRTRRGLTDKHVLLALSSGALVEMPWQYLEPRRPTTPSAAQREEGLVPYAPELPLPPDAVLNYNRSVARPARLHVAPAELESISLVLLTGLDLYYTRVAPSKTFDLLKDDFDYYLITIVLAALIVATHCTKYFASRKMLRQAWK